MTMSWGYNETGYEENKTEASQTIFLATRMDLMAQIVSKEERPHKPLLQKKRRQEFSRFVQSSTIH